MHPCAECRSTRSAGRRRRPESRRDGREGRGAGALSGVWGAVRSRRGGSSRLMPFMSSRLHIRRARVIGLGLAAVGLAATVAPALASATTPTDTVDHAYRHGLVPTVEHTLIGAKNGTTQH